MSSYGPHSKHTLHSKLSAETLRARLSLHPAHIPNNTWKHTYYLDLPQVMTPNLATNEAVEPNLPPGLTPETPFIHDQSCTVESTRIPPDWFHEGQHWTIVPQRIKRVGDPRMLNKDIDFKSLRKHTKGIPGVCMIDCQSGTTICAPNEALHQMAKSQYINFRINWPAYEHAIWINQIPVLINNRPITRAELASVIANEFEEFIRVYKNAEVPPFVVDWSVGTRYWPSGYELQHMRLIRMVNIELNNWMADVAVVKAKLLHQ